MTKLHRKELKQDEVREKIAETFRGIKLHSREAVYLITIAVAIGFIALAWSYYEKNQQQESQKLLGAALLKFEAPVTDPTKPVDPGQAKPEIEYKSDAEKYAAALKDFDTIAQKYGNTPAAGYARYQAGVCAFYLKDYAKAEDYLKQSEHVSEKNILYFLSRIGLANVYAATAKTDQAVSVLNEAIDKNRDIVPQGDLLLQLADIYKKAGKNKEATDTLQKVADQFKETPAGFQAQNQLNEMKSGS